jgi:hypothetical protein
MVIQMGSELYYVYSFADLSFAVSIVSFEQTKLILIIVIGILNKSTKVMEATALQQAESRAKLVSGTVERLKGIFNYRYTNSNEFV